jgi:DNA mismatch repair protein MutH
MEKYKPYLRKMSREELITCSLSNSPKFASKQAESFYYTHIDVLKNLTNPYILPYKIADLRKLLKPRYIKPNKDDIFKKLTTLKDKQPLPGKNKGYRGQILEKTLGLKNCSDLTDFVDGELKTVTIGQSNAITSVGHLLDEIIEAKVDFENSKLYEKIKNIVWAIYDKKGELIKNTMVSSCENTELQEKLIQDYNFIADEIRTRYKNRTELGTINGPNDILQIRTKASKVRGSYIPLVYKGFKLKDKYMAFYYKANYIKNLIGN